jgi:hypothetical protein
VHDLSVLGDLVPKNRLIRWLIPQSSRPQAQRMRSTQDAITRQWVRQRARGTEELCPLVRRVTLDVLRA